MDYTIAAFYWFTPIDEPAAMRSDLQQTLASLNLCGTLLIAPEGINGMLAGAEGAINAALDILRCQTGLPREDVKFSHAAAKPFNRLKIRVKREIITFNQPDADPTVRVGKHVAASDWNDLIVDPDVLLLDTRNHYETRLGSFANALDPGIQHFSDFAGYVRQNLDPSRHPKVAMFCTGGIRCEKASSFLLGEGFAEVYHLKGGILKYLEDIPAEASHWQGDCYVFDQRMAVGHGLSTGGYAMCFSCGEALTEADKIHEQFEEGVSCHLCHANTTVSDKARFRMRHAQMSAPGKNQG